jgi:prepilin-type N-terminal cleavage/methylation domain-containing protein
VWRPSKALRRFFSCRTPGALHRLRDAGDEGFTLIELVIVLIILPLIIGAITVALFVTFQDQVGVSTRVSTSADAQVTSAYFVRDVESAMYVTTTYNPASGSAAWPSAGEPVSDCPSKTTRATLLLSLAWPSGRQPIYDGVTVVSYWRIPSGVLERDLCQGTALPSDSITSRDFVSPFANALLSCVSTKPCETAATQWVPAQWVSGVTIAATEPLTRTQPLANTKGSPKGSYDYNLTAAPRASGIEGTYANGGSGPGSTPLVPPILALGSGPRVIKESGGKTTPTPTPTTVTTTTFTKAHPASITVVTGQAVMNTGYFDMAKKTQFQAPYIWVTTGKTPCRSGKCGSKSPKGSDTVMICARTKLTKLTKSKPTCYTPTPKKQKPWTTHTPVSDPFASLTDPTAVLLTYHPRPCVVPRTGNLQPGEYDCGGAPFIPTGDVKLAGGIYIFDTGLKILGSATLTGNTVLIYLPCKANDPWVPAGTEAATCNEGFQVSNGTVKVTPFRTPKYSNLWFWQNKGDKTAATVHGQGAIRVTTGVLYAPAAEVKMSGLGTSGTNVGAIVATTFDVANSHVSVQGFGLLK